MIRTLWDKNVLQKKNCRIAYKKDGMTWDKNKENFLSHLIKLFMRWQQQHTTKKKWTKMRN